MKDACTVNMPLDKISDFGNFILSDRISVKKTLIFKFRAILAYENKLKEDSYTHTHRERAKTWVFRLNEF